MGMVPRKIKKKVKRSGFAQGMALGAFLVTASAVIWMLAHIVMAMKGLG